MVLLGLLDFWLQLFNGKEGFYSRLWKRQIKRVLMKNRCPYVSLSDMLELTDKKGKGNIGSSQILCPFSKIHYSSACAKFYCGLLTYFF